MTESAVRPERSEPESKGGRRRASLLCAAALAAACATAPPAPSGPPPEPPAAVVPDTALGLVHGSVFDTPAPPSEPRNESAPGEDATLPRPYRKSPPRIPHAIDGFLPITRTDNACLGCHVVAEKKAPSARPERREAESKDQPQAEPTPIPASHLVDLRHAPDRAGTEVAGARRDCVLCHVPTSGAPPLVENRFRP